MTNYDDNINHPRFEPKNHKRMDLLNRAAQFGSFRALKGHEEAIEETARVTNNKIELDEYAKERLNYKLKYILENSDLGFKITITYFEEDDKKAGGKYIKHTGKVNKIDEFSKKIIMDDEYEINIDNIIGIQI